MAYQFKGITSDKANLDHKHSNKIQSPNFQFGSDVIGDPNKAVEKAIEEHGISHIEVSSIINRSENNFETISVITLKKSIRQVGLLSPILVWETSDGKYMLIAGHRRVTAYREILNDLRKENASEVEIKKYKTIPAIVFDLVDDTDSRLGTDSKYITKQTEKLMYESSNLEVRQISRTDLSKHILYFYNMIQEDTKYKDELLRRRNAGKQRFATKLNMPDTISEILTKDLGFTVSSIYVWRYVNLYESRDKYPAYYKIAERRIDAGEKLQRVYDDFFKAVEVKEAPIEDKNIKKEYLNRIESEQEPVASVYNECFNLKPEIKKALKKQDFINLLKDIKKGTKTIDEVLKMLEQ